MIVARAVIGALMNEGKSTKLAGLSCGKYQTTKALVVDTMERLGLNIIAALNVTHTFFVKVAHNADYHLPA